MLIRYLPDQVAKMWKPFVKEAIAKTLRHLNGDLQNGLVNVAYAILNNEAVLWGFIDDDTKGLKGIILTTFSFDPVMRNRNLLIYSIIALDTIQRDAWFEGIDVLKRFAVSEGCTGLNFYTNDPLIMKLGQKLGGKAEWIRIDFEVEDG